MYYEYRFAVLVVVVIVKVTGVVLLVAHYGSSSIAVVDIDQVVVFIEAAAAA